MSEELTVLNNKAPQELVVAQKVNALSRLFTLKPATLELVSKASRQDGVTPGKLRVVQTNEHFDEMRAVILVEPLQQRKQYRKGEYSKEALECFSLDSIQPHNKAKHPPALYCANCPLGDIMWVKYREAKNKGVSGDNLSALIPACKQFWHLFIADRNTQSPYYLNVGGTSVKSFENAMQNIARLFQMILANIKAERRAGKDTPMPNSIGDVIWQISFTIYPSQPIKGGQFVLGFKDFKVMSLEDRADFGQMVADMEARRNAGQLQTQEASEAEEEAAAVAEPASGAVRQAEIVSVTTNEVAKQNAQIQI